MLILFFIIAFIALGAPVFTILGGITQIAWLQHPNEALRHVRFLAPDVLDERFAGSPILVTVPLFTFVGYVMAESKTPERIVRASNAFLGWMPGGLAIVCILASAFFTTLSGGSAVTIVAIGALLLPALLQRGYPKDYALGLVMTGGSLGLLLPPALPLLIYSLVAGIDFTKTFKAGLIPGFMIIGLLALHAMYIGIKYKIPRTSPEPVEMAAAVWHMKWEIGIPIVILGGLATGLTGIDESAAIAAAYVLLIETVIYKDLTFKDFPRIARNSMALAGAIILIMAAALALTNYIISEQIPEKVFHFVTHLGATERWHFLIVLNLFAFVLSVIMDGISAILVAVPLLVPFAATLHLSPFHLAMMFLLNLEIAYLTPPLGQNLFVASFRFNQPMVKLYRIALPFLGILFIGLVILMSVPSLSTMLVQKDIRLAREKAEQFHEPPREAWLMECVQEDRNNPLPCSEEDKKKWGSGHVIEEQPEDLGNGAPSPSAAPAGSGEAPPTDDLDEDELLKEMMGEAPAGSASAAPAGSAEAPKGDQLDVDELVKELLADDKAAPSAAPAPSAHP